MEIKSKYRDKHYIIEKPTYSEFMCLKPECGCVFMIDVRWTKDEWDEKNLGYWMIVHCPYCGSISKHWIK